MEDGVAYLVRIGSQRSLLVANGDVLGSSERAMASPKRKLPLES